MGANMARRLKETGYTITAVYDVNVAAAQALALELGCVAAEELKAVTALSDVIITVVTDDQAMKKISPAVCCHAPRAKFLSTARR